MQRYYVHDLNPLVPVLDIPYYWLVYVFGLFFLWGLGRYLIDKGHSELKESDYIDYLLVGWFSMLLGSRLFYVFVYNWSHYKDQVGEIFRFWNGGMSFHGGLLGAATGVFILGRYKKKQSLFLATDLAVTSVPMIIGLGRIANFINGELAGRVTTVPWAVIFPRYLDGLPRHPSQLYQAALEGFGLFFLMWKTKSKLAVVGYQTRRFLLIYGTLRILGEVFREPDSQIGYLLLDLTLGQVLSLCMILFAGLWYAVKVRKSARGQT